jgi:hypothetical protein
LLSESKEAPLQQQNKESEADTSNSQRTIVENRSQSLQPCWLHEEDALQTPIGNDGPCQPLMEQLSLTPEIIEATALSSTQIERIPFPIAFSSHPDPDSQRRIVGGNSMNQCATSAEDETLLDNDDDEDLNLCDYLARWVPKQTSNYSTNTKHEIMSNSQFGFGGTNVAAGDIDDLLICEEESSTVVVKSGSSKEPALSKTRPIPAKRKRAVSTSKARGPKRHHLSRELTSGAFFTSIFCDMHMK